MSKKLITACMALVALAAFALPAVASASPQITHPTGTRLDPTTKECTAVKGTVCIVGTNVGNTKLMTDPGGETAPSVLSECNTAKMTGYLEKNTGTLIEATIHTATFSGTGAALAGMNECTGFGGIGNLTPTTNGGGTDGESVTNATPWCIKSGASDTFTLRGGKCSAEATKIRFILHITRIFEPTKSNECKYERSTPIEGTFTTDTTSGEDLGKDAILSVKPGKTEAEKAKTTFKGEAGNPVECPASGTLEMGFTLETDVVATEPLYIS